MDGFESSPAAVLAGRRALVTGASRGLGRAIAMALARAGAQLVIHYHLNDHAAVEVCRAIEAFGGAAEPLPANLASPDGAQILADRLGPRPLDILVNNAGVWQPTPLGSTSAAQIDELLQVNLRSVFVLAQALLERIPCGGSIVNISSVAARTGVVGRSLYGATKAAVEAFTRNWALELAPRGIRVNAIAPGYLETDMTAVHFANPETLARALRSHPFGRMAAPQEVAAVALFLASPAAHAITGVCLNASAGFVIQP